MAENSGVNPSQSELLTEQLEIEGTSPPPYSAIDPISRSSQCIVQETIIIQPALRTDPVYYYCPRCHQRVLTNVEYVNSNCTHMLAAFICGLTSWCFICCLAGLPYSVKSCQKTMHYCPQCNTLLGEYSKL